MSSPLLHSLIAQIQENHFPLPLIVSEEDACFLVSTVKNTSLESLDSREYIPDVFLYEREPEKNTFSIKTVLAFIDRTTEKPLYPPAIYILRDVDTAEIAGMNALLKILEEPPTESIILLTATQAELFLPTIQSRTIFVSENISSRETLPEGIEEALRKYISGDPIPLLSFLYKGKFTRGEASIILEQYEIFLKENILDAGVFARLSDAMITLETTNVNPRHVLDQVFLLSL